MLRFRPDHHKTKKMCKNAVKKLLFIIMCIPAQYQTQEISDKVILENGGLLRLICKNQEMCNKAVDNYAHALEFVPNG